MQYSPEKQQASVKPRIILHGGAGNITRSNLPPPAYVAYRVALLSILTEANILLQQPGANALDIATHAVTLLEKNPLFNAGVGAVYTTEGTHELEASVMVSKGYRKRGVGVMKVRHVKSPILLAKEMLKRGEDAKGGGAQGHCQLEGETCDRLAKHWGLEMCTPGYYWTKKRWQEHRRGLGLDDSDHEYEKARHDASKDDEYLKDDTSAKARALIDGVEQSEPSSDKTEPHVDNDPSWDGKEYLPQGTVGCVVLDSLGTLCVATSTGGLTNKLPGRIGDTPTLGAGFWAEEWPVPSPQATSLPSPIMSPAAHLAAALSGVADCVPGLRGYLPLPTYNQEHQTNDKLEAAQPQLRAVALSGTGNGDSFLRLSAVRTAAAMARFKRTNLDLPEGMAPLQDCVNAVAGPGGYLQQSAEERWHVSGEGEGGMIGIDLRDGEGSIVADFDCGGLFRCWVDDGGRERMMVFREEY